MTTQDVYNLYANLPLNLDDILSIEFSNESSEQESCYSISITFKYIIKFSNRIGIFIFPDTMEYKAYLGVPEELHAYLKVVGFREI